MNITILLNTLAIYLNEYFRAELDPSLKPKDSSGCKSCRDMKYDFIIVGAGAAGCVLANRLSENPDLNVLLIEAGGDEDYITDIPALGGRFTGTMYDWNYTTVKQEAVCQNNEGYCKFPSGHVMGGSSTIGDMIYMRGNQIDYDEWANLGNSGWSFKDVLPHFLKSEKSELTETKGSPYHSTKGLLPVGTTHYNNSILQNFMIVASHLGFKFTDYNGPNQLGMAYDQLNIEGATRSSSSKAYLNPIRDRPNLHIFKNTLATKILVSNDGNRKAIGVACVTEGQGYEVYSSKEVILSAGAINTPKLLMLSGIGPKKHLEELGIPVYADLPVGENLVDYPYIILHFQSNSTELIYDETSFKKEVIEYAKNRKGIFSAPQRSVMGVANIPFSDGASDTKAPNALFGGGYSLSDLAFNGDEKYPTIANYLCLLTPSSRGTIKLKSNNFKDVPLIDPHSTLVNSDIKHMKELLVSELHYFEDPGWKKYNLKLIVPSQCKYDRTLKDEFISCFVKYDTHIGTYPTSTAKMGPASDKTAVVDSSLKVHTVDSLRVVDASVIPKPVRALPYATVDMIAEKASNIVRKHYSKN